MEKGDGTKISIEKNYSTHYQLSSSQSTVAQPIIQLDPKKMLNWIKMTFSNLIYIMVWLTAKKEGLDT